MPTFEVTIKGTVTKTYTVEAVDADRAEHYANIRFNLNDDGVPESLERDTVSVEEFKDET